MNTKISSLVLILFAGLIFSGKALAQTASPKVGFNGNTVAEIKTSLDNNSVSFVIFTGDGFNKEAFMQKADVYSKMFTLTAETVSNNTTYTVKFNDGFQNLKYIMRLFVSDGITEINFGTSVMSTEKFFAQFE